MKPSGNKKKVIGEFLFPCVKLSEFLCEWFSFPGHIFLFMYENKWFCMCVKQSEKTSFRKNISGTSLCETEWGKKSYFFVRLIL